MGEIRQIWTRFAICDGEFLPEYNDFAIFIETPSILARFAENIVFVYIRVHDHVYRVCSS